MSAFKSFLSIFGHFRLTSHFGHCRFSYHFWHFRLTSNFGHYRLSNHFWHLRLTSNFGHYRLSNHFWHFRLISHFWHFRLISHFGHFRPTSHFGHYRLSNLFWLTNPLVQYKSSTFFSSKARRRRIAEIYKLSFLLRFKSPSDLRSLKQPQGSYKFEFYFIICRRFWDAQKIQRKMFDSDSVTRLGDLLDVGQLFKACGTIILPESLTFSGKFCKGVKIYHFSSEIFFGQLLQTFGDFLLLTLDSNNEAVFIHWFCSYHPFNHSDLIVSSQICLFTSRFKLRSLD